MTRQELEQQYLVVDGITFTPRYEYKQIEVIEDGETILVDDYTIIATADEVYQEWLEQQNQPIMPSTQKILNAQLLKDNATMKVETNNQKSLNSQLLLEIAKLKQGGTTNV